MNSSVICNCQKLLVLNCNRLDLNCAYMYIVEPWTFLFVKQYGLKVDRF